VDSNLVTSEMDSHNVHNVDSELPLVVIAIVSTNEAQNIIGCLTSLAASTYRNFHVVICENGGEEGFQPAVKAIEALGVVRPLASGERDGTRLQWSHDYRRYAFVDNGPPITILRAPRNLGYAGGVNACIASVASEDWHAIWVLNPDTFPEPDALGALVRRQREGNYGIVGSRLVFTSSGLVQTWGGNKWRPWLGRGKLLGLNQPVDTLPNITAIESRLGFVSGASMYVSRSYIENVGVMDENFFVYCEEVDWCLRRGSFRLGYAHDSVVRHIAGAKSGSSPRKKDRSRFSLYLMERNRILLARKRYRRWWWLLAFLALGQASEHLLRARSVRCFRIALAGWWAGIRGETGAPPFLRASDAANRAAYQKGGS